MGLASATSANGGSAISNGGGSGGGGTINGSCNCGAITVTLKRMPTKSAICHCKVCARFGGTPGAYFLMLPSENFEVNGDPKCWSTISEKQRTVSRYFCGECGCSIYAKGDWAGPNDIHVYGGICDTDLPSPAAIVWGEHKPKWHCIEATTTYEKQGDL